MTWGFLLLPEDDLAAVGAWGHTPWGGLQTLEGDVEVARGQRNAGHSPADVGTETGSSLGHSAEGLPTPGGGGRRAAAGRVAPWPLPGKADIQK